jgi:dihydroorotase
VACVAPCGKIKVDGAKILNAKDCIVSPGFIDLHTHLRDPGQKYKESIETGTAAAVAGGFTRICCMPNTEPVNDSANTTDYIVKRAHEAGLCHVHPVGAITKGLAGESLAGIAGLKKAGCVAVSDDGSCVQNAQLMRLAFDYAKSFGVTIAVHAQDEALSAKGHINESLTSTRLGIPGIPNAAEDVMIARDLMLAELTGARIHVCHVATARGVELIAQAKARGLSVTCEVTPHHFTLTDESITEYDTNFKMYPPLRSKNDVKAIKAALKKGGIIDAIATDHAPHGLIDKELEFDKAPFGIIGLETALPLSLELVRQKIISLKEMIRLFTSGPASVFNLPAGTLKRGSVADVTIFNPHQRWTYEESKIVSKSKNSPFVGKKLHGKVTWTIVAGKIESCP